MVNNMSNKDDSRIKKGSIECQGKICELYEKLKLFEESDIGKDLDAILKAALEEKDEIAMKELKKLEKDFSALSKNLSNLAGFIDKKF